MSLPLLITTKEKAGQNTDRTVTIGFRDIERWANGQTFINEITSTDGSVTITNPTGPVVNLHVAGGGGGGGGYASLTGPGQTTTPGELDQAGRFHVSVGTPGNNASLDVGTATSNTVTVGATGTINIQSTSVNISGNGLNFNFNPGNIQFDTVGQVLVNTGLLQANQGATILCQGSGPYFSLENVGSSGNFANIFVYTGNPNGVLTGLAGGGVCFETSATPHVWIWPAGGAAWTSV